MNEKLPSEQIRIYKSSLLQTVFFFGDFVYWEGNMLEERRLTSKY